MYWTLCSRSPKNLNARTAVAIGYKDPNTIATETRPLVQAIPSSRLARKSAAPMKISTGISFLLKFPVVLNLRASEIVTKNVAALIETIVSNALLWEPIAIKVSANPKPAAAPKASKIGLTGKPWDSSGPLAQKTPIKELQLALRIKQDYEKEKHTNPKWNQRKTLW